jgi:ABC-type branched-subunit amino acid transport system substrate-binding protein
MRGTSRAAAIVVATVGAALALAASGCAASADAPNDPLSRPAGEVRLYGSDGNMLNAMGDLLKDHPGGLLGMKGTTPLPRLSQNFRDRLRTVDGHLKDEAYAAETYDAVVISALAAQVANSPDPKGIAAQINGVTTNGTACEAPSACLALIEAGKDIAYRGITLGLGGFTDVGEPSASTFGIVRFGENNRLDPSKTEYVPAGDPTKVTSQPPPKPAAPEPGAPGAGPLKIGALLPHTGALAGGGPPMFAAAQLAVREINAAGGVLGRPVQWVDGDDFTDPQKAKATVRSLIDAGVHVIIGAGASSITKAVLPTIVDAGVVLFSPSNTAAELTKVDDSGLYFRTAPPDGLQAAALTDIIMRDGVRRVVIVAREDTYGRGLMDAVKDNLLRAGLETAHIKTVAYNSERPDFIGLGEEVKAFAPDGVLLIGYDETAKAIDSMIEAGLSSRPV